MPLTNDADVSEQVIAAAIAVHRAMGPGLLESIYEKALSIELPLPGLPVRMQVEMPVEYRGHVLGVALRLDLLVDERLIVEIKSVSRLDELHPRQLLAYPRVAQLRTGLLINFNVTRLTMAYGGFRAESRCCVISV